VRAAAGLPSIMCYHRGQVRQLPRVRLSLAPESMAWRRSWALLHRFVFPMGTATPALDLSAAWSGRRPPRPSAGARRSGLVLSPVRILCPTGRCCHPSIDCGGAGLQERHRAQFGFCSSPVKTPIMTSSTILSSNTVLLHRGVQHFSTQV
jgi:hypothetical protein